MDHTSDQEVVGVFVRFSCAASPGVLFMVMKVFVKHSKLEEEEW
jgi:hypothetical protein